MNYLQNKDVMQKRLEYRLKRKQINKISEIEALKQQITENTIKECDICKEIKVMREFKLLVCNHDICKSCFYEIKQRNRNKGLCPFCREKLAGQDDVKQIIITISIPSQNRVLKQTRGNIVFPYRINTICEIDSEEVYSESNNQQQEDPSMFTPLNLFDSDNQDNATNGNRLEESIDYVNLSMGYVIIQLIYKLRAVIYGICLFFFLIWE